MGEKGLDLVYGGAAFGLMGAVADAVLDFGRHVTGVIPHGLERREFAHPRLTEKCMVASMHERKALMTSLADGFVALPGGFGTMDELFEALTWEQIGLHRKPIALVNIGGFYDPLVQWARLARDEGFIAEAVHDLLIVEARPAAALERLLNAPTPTFPVLWSTLRP
jgi:uncharacterized protein (TIGR00730 family)